VTAHENLFELKLPVRRALLLAIICLAVIATWAGGRRLGMTGRVTTRHAFYSIPCAMSRLYFGSHGYTILGDVADVFIKANPNISNDTLQQALLVHPNPDRVMLFPADDKGDADFATLSIMLFGLSIEGLYYTWFVLFAVPIAIYVAVYWRDASHLAALAILLLAVYTAFFALPLTTELFSIHNPRSFGIVSLASVLHLSFAILDRQRRSAANVAAAAAQALFIAFSIHVRTTEFWQVLSVAGVAGAVALMERGYSRVLVVWPALVLVAAIGGLELYQRVAFERVYASTHIQHRIFWHNVGIGFALNPALAKKYSLSIDDTPMMQLVRLRLTETGRAREIDDVFRPIGQEEYAFYGIAKDYVRYEQIARDVVLSIVWHNKMDALKTFVIDKPRVLFRQLAWAAGYGGYSTTDLYLTGQGASLVSESGRREHGIYLNLLTPWVVAGVLAALLLEGGGSRQAGTVFAVATWMCAMSLLPALIAYPIISALGVALATVPFFIFSVFGLVFQAVAEVVWTRGREHRLSAPA
jgi:hypothetical protein